MCEAFSIFYFRVTRWTVLLYAEIAKHFWKNKKLIHRLVIAEESGTAASVFFVFCFRMKTESDFRRETATDEVAIAACSLRSARAKNPRRTTNARDDAPFYTCQVAGRTYHVSAGVSGRHLPCAETPCSRRVARYRPSVGVAKRRAAIEWYRFVLFACTTTRPKTMTSTGLCSSYLKSFTAYQFSTTNQTWRLLKIANALLQT